jgi:uroporphyrinogen decarboxylase
LPDGGALFGGKPGPIQNRSDFNSYPWDDIPQLYWQYAEEAFDSLAVAMPMGMKAVGGVGNGVFEIAEDLVGLEYLPFMQVDDSALYTDVFNKIGDLMVTIWTKFLRQYKETFAVCRFGDDLGFKSSLLTNPKTIRNHILTQYQRVISTVRNAGKPFLWHSCGCIFEVMDDVIDLGINAKHSNEDTIAPFSRWINDYSDRIGLIGGFDMDFLCQKTPDEIYNEVLQKGTEYRNTANGYALGSGNSIPDYVPVDNYLAMVKAAQKIRLTERA